MKITQGVWVGGTSVGGAAVAVEVGRSVAVGGSVVGVCVVVACGRIRVAVGGALVADGCPLVGGGLVGPGGSGVLVGPDGLVG
jgi:hypothetical protein